MPVTSPWVQSGASRVPRPISVPRNAGKAAASALSGLTPMAGGRRAAARQDPRVPGRWLELHRKLVEETSGCNTEPAAFPKQSEEMLTEVVAFVEPERDSTQIPPKPTCRAQAFARIARA
jgi:hypothetical protein